MAFTITGTCFLSTGILPVYRRNFISSSSDSTPKNPNFSTRRLFAASTTAEQFSRATTTTKRTSLPNSSWSSDKKKREEGDTTTFANVNSDESNKKSLKDYFTEAKDLIKTSDGGGGPPRWFSPLECGARTDNSPMLLYLPGIDGVGLGLIRQHQRLGKIFDIWCLHIPVQDRTSFTDLVKLVERTIRSENFRSPNRPIYLVGDSLGGCLALEVAARNPDIDLLLILANPATSFRNSRLRHLFPFLEVVPDQLHLHLPYALSLFTGDTLRKETDNAVKGLNLQQIMGVSQDLLAVPSYLPVVADILPKETFLWKMRMLRSASAHVNTRLHAVKAQTLILSSGNDQLVPSTEEGKRLKTTIPKCEIRNFEDSGHFLLLEDGIDLVTIIKGASFYRRGKYHNYASDFLPPTPAEINKTYEPNRWFVETMSPVMFSTLEDGKVVKGLAGLPSDGPVLYIGYHMLLGLELVPLVYGILRERNILVRGMAHPMLFMKPIHDGFLPDISNYDTMRIMGAVPVTATNFYKLLSSKSHVLMYPGGMREAVHRKGEQYKLFWPKQNEFVRVAAAFGAKIVPFATVGEDDIGEVIFDYDDQIKFPLLRDFIEQTMDECVTLRSPEDGEVANQQVHTPWIRPKIPGRFYYCFGKPIETAGRKQELRDREKAQELYLQVKSEVERLLAYLKEKREHDPYRNIVTRLAYQAAHGFASEVPTFEP